MRLIGTAFAAFFALHSIQGETRIFRPSADVFTLEEVKAHVEHSNKLLQEQSNGRPVANRFVLCVGGPSDADVCREKEPQAKTR